MDVNPWEAPEQRGMPPGPPGPWRRRWKRLCLGSLGALGRSVLTFLTCFGLSLLFRPKSLAWMAFGIVGFGAYLGAIASIPAAVIGGIGWVLAPREFGEHAD